MNQPQASRGWFGAARDALGPLLPRRADYAGFRTGWRADLLAGITVAVVALPLALAFGVTSGLGAAAGLITAIVAGIVAGVTGGSRWQVSGPTGAMTVVLVPVVARFGPGGVVVVAALAGLLLVIAALIRSGRYIALVPWPVVEGFTVGIAIIIFLQQVPSALGVDKPEGENTVAVAVRAVMAWGGQGWQALALTVAVAALMIMIPRAHRALPASLIAVIVATLVAELVSLTIARIGTIPSTLPAPTLPTIPWNRAADLVGPVLAVAALAALESLLSAKVADGMADGGEHDPDRELFGQGLANVAVSLFGGMPATGAIARTAVNVRAGAHSRLSAVVHGLVLLLIVYSLTGAVELIPLAALAGVLMVTAVRMVEFGSVRMLLRSTRGDAAVMIATAVATVVFDLVVAVEVGIILASILTLRSVARSTVFQRERTPHVDIDDTTEHELLAHHIVTYRLDGALFFGAAQRFLLELTDVADVQVVILRLGGLTVLDSTGAQALADLVGHLQHRKIAVLLCSVSPTHRRLIERIGVIAELSHENHLVPTIDEALAHAQSHVEKAA